jgi:hypothetical protein
MALLGRNARIGLTLLVAALSAPAPQAAEGVQLAEQKIKAALIYNFLKYTQWPGVADRAPMVVCLFGGDPFDGHLGPLAGRTVNQHMIEVRKIGTSAEAASCALLVVHGDEKSSWAELRKRLSSKDVLTVSDFDGFAAEGGMIEFARIDDRVGVKVNVDAVAATRLVVQERLLKLASIVRKPPGP